jgi:dienelactone hydrolase
MRGDFGGRTPLRTIALALTLACLAVPSAVTVAAPPPASLFAPEPEFDVAEISPAGTRLVRTGRVNNRRALIGFDIDKRKMRPLLDVDSDDFNVRWCRFKNESWLVCEFYLTEFHQGRPYTLGRILSFDYEHPTKQILIRKATTFDLGYAHDVIDWLPKDPTHILVEMPENGSIYPSVLSFDVQTGRQQRVLHPREGIFDWMTDGNGTVRFGSGYDAHMQLTYITRKSDDAPWRTLLKASAFSAPFETVGFGPTPDTLLVMAERNGRKAVYELDLNDTKDMQLVFAHPTVDVGGPIRWSNHRIVGFWYETDVGRNDLFDRDAMMVQRIIDETLPNGGNGVESITADGRRFIATSQYDTRPATFHLFDRDSRSMLNLGSMYPALDDFVGAPMRPVEIEVSRDLTLPGYLTVPTDSDGRHLPTIVVPHGGPYARDDWGYDVLVQFLASRGYAVLQVNFRGSEGYGSAWYEAGRQKWGTVMIDDITAAARWSIDQGVADPARMCVVGWSFGGYAALMSAVREPTLYRCAVSIAGVSDLRALFEEELRYYGGRASVEHAVGDDRKELDAGSPVRAANRIQVPVLLVHGAADGRVFVDHSRRMAQALERAGKPYELVVIDGGDHSLRRSAWRLRLYEKLEQFLAANLGGSSGQATPAAAAPP